MVEQAVVEPQGPEVPPSPAPAMAPEPFALDENALASLSPEQRASLDPIFDKWKTNAKAEIERSSKEAEEKYKPVSEKASALEQLAQWAPFQNWWAEQQRAMAQGQTVATQQAVQQSRPQDFASPQEWSEAVLNASNGDPAKLQQIQARMFATMATPVVQQLQAKQQEIDTKVEMRNLMEDHPDYKDLDQIGLDGKGQGVSLLEHCLNWAEVNRRPLEEGYQMAKRWADSLGAQKKAEAMGMVHGKRESVTESGSTQTGNTQVVLVDSMDEVVKRSMDDQLSGTNKGVRYAVREKTK